MTSKTPWQKIRDAGQRGTGVRLDADEVDSLCKDDALMTRAMLDDENAKGVPDDKVRQGFE